MKNYFKSLFAECPRYRMVIWWVFRALMIYAFIKGFFPGEGESFDITNPLQVGANFLCMFVWEVFMMLPKTNSLRHVPSVVQTFLIIGIFAASFGGKFMNFYLRSPVLGHRPAPYRRRSLRILRLRDRLRYAEARSCHRSALARAARGGRFLLPRLDRMGAV